MDSIKDPVSFFFAIILIIVALAFLFFGKTSNYQGLTVFGISVLALLALMHKDIAELIFSTKEYNFKLVRVQNKVQNIAEIMKTLVVAQEIQALQADNSILLDYEPVPQSVRIICGPLTHFPRERYGYKLEGKVIKIIHEQTLNQVKSRLPDGVTIEYLRMIPDVNSN